ncbi:hypothetical protein [Actinomadura violacea]|uniref:Uncharacterized protein n=1 Tax=Actinomadura violacea TaxID=2819934 RepID=A0ABS3SAA2_9ACTN|nr:hypothetical protein [Actinomadura violacea]MBO2465944.1 hypothetical protein [Actinomadura violacea]
MDAAEVTAAHASAAKARRRLLPFTGHGTGVVMQTIVELAPVVGGALNVVAAGIGAAVAWISWRRRG